MTVTTKTNQVTGRTSNKKLPVSNNSQQRNRILTRCSPKYLSKLFEKWSVVTVHFFDHFIDLVCTIPAPTSDCVHINFNKENKSIFCCSYVACNNRTKMSTVYSVTLSERCSISNSNWKTLRLIRNFVKERGTFFLLF